MTRSTLITALLAVGLSAVAGCDSSNEGMLHGETFNSPGQTTSIGQVAQAQASTGAKADSVLYDRHFTGSALNALGQAKLDLILKGSPLGEPIKLYFAMPHDTVATREAAVTAYLDKAGVTVAETSFAEGSNPNNTTPAVYNLAGIYSIQKDSYSGQAADMSGGVSR